MTIRLYELAGADPERVFSPFCWRVRMALHHKGLAFETVPWRFMDKAAIAHSGQDRVPVLDDGDHTVSDSWDIALDLERRYPDLPSLFGAEAGHSLAGQALSRFYYDWSAAVLLPAVSRMLVLDIFNHLQDGDKAYFRTTREQRFGMALEDAVSDRDQRVRDFRKLTLAPLRETLRYQPYLGGAQPLYADYILFGTFQWARAISPFPLLEPGDPVHDWRERLLDAFDGAARKTPAYAA